MMPQKMLVIGDDEVDIFHTERKYLNRIYNVKVSVDSKAGRKLSECIDLVQKKMTKDTDILLLWALTAYAWKKIIIQDEKYKIAVFGPTSFDSLTDIVSTMNQIVHLVKQINPNCNVFLCIPTVKDMYKFNQNQLINLWGQGYKDYLIHHKQLNPLNMQNHSIKVYHEFCSLIINIPKYHWLDKQCLMGYQAVNNFSHIRQRKSLHTKYLQRKTLSLDLQFLPDGVHGNSNFVKNFCRFYKCIFELKNGNAHLRIKLLEESLEENDEEMLSYQQLLLISRTIPQLLIQPSTPEQRRDPENNTNSHREFEQPSISRQSTLYEHLPEEYRPDPIRGYPPLVPTPDEGHQQSHPPISWGSSEVFSRPTYLGPCYRHPNSMSLPDYQSSMSHNNHPPSVLMSFGTEANIQTNYPSSSEIGPINLQIEAALKNTLDVLLPFGSNRLIRHRVLNEMKKLLDKELNMLPYRRVY